ncbi:hypothetical protein ONQ62_27110, partial [Salmonella enterica subsp. enterica serovar Virginia]|nr:hypothetical protein [Salmonella enterica subsp. enterica serovar Virginia]
ITLVAGPALISRYQQAFSAIGRDVSTVDGDMAFQAGIRSIAQAVGAVSSAGRRNGTGNGGAGASTGGI